MNQLEEPQSAHDTALAAILRVLHDRTGTDFSMYRPCTIERRVRNQMMLAGADTFEQYLKILRGDALEAARLLERVTIKVSRFYRNKSTFDWLRLKVIPDLGKAVPEGPIRIWSAGCGFGEEAYTLSMLLEEAGLPGYVVATDIDLSALRLALQGRYRRAAFDELPEELFERYIERDDEAFRVAEPVRARVRFAHHDIISGRPPPGGGTLFDLVCCRNVLIYLSRTIQEDVLHSLRARVRAGGILSLGEAEWPSASIAPSLEALPHQTHLFRALEHSPACIP